MTRTLKALGLALLAACALSAVAASSASATKDIVTCTGVSNCDVTAGPDTGVTTTFGTKKSTLSVVCSTEKFSGTVTSGAEKVTVFPTYSGCTALGGAATVDTTGCDYTLTSLTTTRTKTDDDGKDEGTETDAPVDVNCTGTNKIKITAPACTISIGTQTGLHGVSYKNEGTPASTEDITVKATVDGIAYTTSGFGCAIAGLPASGTDGTLTGAATAKGYSHNSTHQTSDHVGLAYHEV